MSLESTVRFIMLSTGVRGCKGIYRNMRMLKAVPYAGAKHYETSSTLKSLDKT